MAPTPAKGGGPNAGQAEAEESDAEFYSPRAAVARAAPVTAEEHRKEQPLARKQQAPPAPVRVALTILPSPPRPPKRKRGAAPPAAAALPLAAPPAKRKRSKASSASAAAAAAAAAPGLPPALPPPLPAGRLSPGRPPMRGKRSPAFSPAGAGAAGASAAAAAAAAAAAVAGPPLAAVALAGRAPAAGEQQPGSRRRKKSGGKQRKTLTAKGKRAAVLAVLADVELGRAAQGAAHSPAGSAATAGRAQQPQQQEPPLQPPQPQQQPQQQQPQQPPPLGPEATANLGRAWSKADISTLTRLAEDRAFLLATLPQHPAEGELDWELISRHFGRYSRGGMAVKQQYSSVQRVVKAARHEGKKGHSYVDLVQAALRTLPEGRGTVYEIQALLKRDHSGKLDKYRDKSGALRWKKAVGEVLRDQPALFEAVGKTATGKHVWALKAQDPAG